MTQSVGGGARELCTSSEPRWGLIAGLKAGRGVNVPGAGAGRESAPPRAELLARGIGVVVAAHEIKAAPRSSSKKRGSFRRRAYKCLGDGELVRAIVGGDTEAVGEVWMRYSPLVRNVIYGRIGHDAATEDIVQDVFLIFLRTAPQMRDVDSLRPYLFGISTRVVSSELRRRKVGRQVILSPTGMLPERTEEPADLSAAEVLQALHRVLERMPARRREAFVLRHAHGFGIPEIAKALDVSESTVKREVVHACESILTRGANEPALAQYLERYRNGGSWDDAESLRASDQKRGRRGSIAAWKCSAQI